MRPTAFRTIEQKETLWGWQNKEEFRVLFLDKTNYIIADKLIGSGRLDYALVYSREVIERALELCVSALILVHNNPSGDSAPSKANNV
tara:strand:+ start:506 stop:769 length:264 start_codon:yes stop_codon:yes gene_type:complete